LRQYDGQHEYMTASERVPAACLARLRDSVTAHLKRIGGGGGLFSTRDRNCDMKEAVNRNVV